MSNPQDNLGAPPPPSASGSSTPLSPITNLQPKKRRVKMLAQKTIATGALSKRLNAQLKATQAQESKHSDDSFKSASEGEGPASSDSEKIQSSPSEVRSPLVESVENRCVLVRRKWQKTRGSGSGEAAEGLVNLSSHMDESGSSIEETIADLLKKVGASYNPKKRRTPTPKIPSTTKNTKKRKVNSPTTTEIPLPKGRATRSIVKQSESELQKALDESKKKMIDKGKAKVAETFEVVDVEEMELVHQEEHTTVEVQIPKPKKTKTSSKKSSSGSKAAESSLVKRTRSAMKNKPVRIAEDEE
ncbi:uncharacterized protein [Nicotiana sylvestris]|uniref:uncharacterized protein n=1 Tax=Nicotiana sylvestris TaxID=4096 RepID=UPI00388C6162